MEDRPGHAEPKYQQIAAVLRAEILAGNPPAGRQLQTKMEMQDRFGVAVNTVERAIEVLRKEGFVESRQGAGMYARVPPPAQPSAEFKAIMERLDEQDAQIRQLWQAVEKPVAE